MYLLSFDKKIFKKKCICPPFSSCSILYYKFTVIAAVLYYMGHCKNLIARKAFI